MKAAFSWPALAVVLSMASVTASANTITLISGNAPIGQLDTNIRVRGAAVIVEGVARAAAAGVSLQQACVVAPCYAWYAAPDGSNWVSCSSNGAAVGPTGGYIYTISFELPQAYTLPVLSMQASSDNGGNVILNGSLIPSNGPNGCTGHNWREVYSYSDPTGFHSGENTLEFWVYNSEGPTGLAFSATVDFSPVPEPSTALALLCGLGGFVPMLWRRRRG